jgi:hypothetical protein
VIIKKIVFTSVILIFDKDIDLDMDNKNNDKDKDKNKDKDIDLSMDNYTNIEKALDIYVQMNQPYIDLHLSFYMNLLLHL